MPDASPSRTPPKYSLLDDFGLPETRSIGRSSPSPRNIVAWTASRSRGTGRARDVGAKHTAPKNDLRDDPLRRMLRPPGRTRNTVYWTIFALTPEHCRLDGIPFPRDRAKHPALRHCPLDERSRRMLRPTITITIVVMDGRQTRHPAAGCRAGADNPLNPFPSSVGQRIQTPASAPLDFLKSPRLRRGGADRLASG